MTKLGSRTKCLVGAGIYRWIKEQSGSKTRIQRLGPLKSRLQMRSQARLQDAQGTGRNVFPEWGGLEGIKIEGQTVVDPKTAY